MSVNSSQGQQQIEASPDSYSQILKSSTIVGGSQAINLLLGIVRVKFAALLLGTVGVGLIGNYLALQGMVSTLAGFGIQSGAVRDVAQAISEKNPNKVGLTILALRRFCWLTGLLGAALIAGFSSLLSQWSFGTRDYAPQITCLAPVILLANLMGGQIATIQGMRRLGDLARIQIFGAVAGTVITIVAYSLLGNDGIIPALLLMAAVQYVIACLFARQIEVPRVRATWGESFAQAGGMARLGFVFMWGGLVASVVLYLTRAWITREVGTAAVGIFGAAFALSGMLIDFVLNAMGADYYPRLTALAHDHRAMTRLVNEQTEVGLLLSVPGLLITLGLAPWLVDLLYTDEFSPAVSLIQWFVLGCLGRVASWPQAFAILALGKKRIFFAVETLINLVHLALIWMGLRLASLEGVAIAFFVMYIFYMAALYFLCSKLVGFRFNKATLSVLAFSLPMVAVTFLCVRVLPIWPSTALAIAMGATSILFGLRSLVRLIGAEHRYIRKVLMIPGLRWSCGI